MTSDPLDALPVEFSQWTAIRATPDRRWLCRRCSAAIDAYKPLHLGFIGATSGGAAAMTHDPAHLRAWLARPVGADRAVIVPTNRQKRAIVAAGWGAVATSYDGVAIEWGSGDVARLAAHEALRWDHGVSEKEIVGPAPRPGTLGASPDPAAMIGLWDQVKAWDALHLEISCLATRRTEQKPSATKATGGDPDAIA